MYVCICNAIRERDLRALARVGDGDAETLYRELGFAPKCRQCLDEAKKVIEEERRSHRLPVCQ